MRSTPKPGGAAPSAPPLHTGHTNELSSPVHQDDVKGNYLIQRYRIVADCAEIVIFRCRSEASDVGS